MASSIRRVLWRIFCLCLLFTGLLAVAPGDVLAQQPKTSLEDDVRRSSTARAIDWMRQFDRDGDRRLDEVELGAALRDAFPEKLQFIRVQRNEKKVAKTLETAVAEFASADGKVRVDLIGAVHVADASYFRALNRRFRDYDVVLYELIAPEGTRVPAGGAKSQHPVGQMQQSIKSILDLSFQLDLIDYQAKNLVHADMSPDEFAASMKDRGESFLQIVFRMMGQAAAQSGQSQGTNDFDLFRALFAKDRSLQLKRILAGQFEDLEGQMSIFEGPHGSTIISERNKRAMEVLRREMDRGHDKIAIFYGAGHLPDMAKRLQTEFKLQLRDTQWLTAWEMEDPKD